MLLNQEDLGFFYEIIRSKRRKKTLAIKVEGDVAKVVIPQRVSQKEALAFLYEKKSWVEKRIKEQIIVAPKTFQTGETFLYLGREVCLQLQQGVRRVQLLEDELAYKKMAYE